MDKQKLSAHVTLIATITLTFIILSMVGVLLVGLFVEKIDNTKIFEAITPAFQMIVGAFVGLVAGIKIGQADE
jgi:undecaprenyl pyrophosphate phosphatase UppP